MDPLNEFPKRDKNHTIETRAETAFRGLLARSSDFFLQVSDHRDYGTDCQIEVVDHGQATNVRLHVQLKGTERALNSDGSISVEIYRSNLNYLLMHRYSFYVCYHLPTDSLRICTADSVLRQYEHDKRNWSEQATLTVRFVEPLTDGRLKALAALAKSDAISSRDKRVSQLTARAEDVSSIVRSALPDLHVPEDDKLALDLLAKLYDRGADEVVSAAFEKFASVLGPTHPAMGLCYMAEINLGMAGKCRFIDRIEDGIAHLTSELGMDRCQIGSLHYSIGNGFAALGKEAEAIRAYQDALRHLSPADDAELLAQCFKNIGSSFQRLGEEEKAARYYRDALRLSPHLGEAHYALGSYFHRAGQYEEALVHLDKVVFPSDTLGKISSVVRLRINVLFNLGDGKQAFREINGLLGDAGNEGWIWPWCAGQVASFGRTSVANAGLATAFWERYLKTHPDSSDGKRELLLSKLYRRARGQDIGKSYAQFEKEFEATIEQVDADVVAFLWDRLGHWAQDEDNWAAAERCFRKAYELEGGHYGYCLGTALNFLDRYEESLPILISQAEEIQPDDMSWFQVARAYENLDRIPECVDAYRKAISLNPNYDLAWFNLGGVHWNSGDREEASRVWKSAVERFPDHELTSKLRSDLPFALL
ncbi:tetratricopeptide repeat protein [Bradyrhizobium sp. Pha-3]|uniref:tetratricopeptide repeat protein n=1 Tax=Bradyrhizobium sp. Pha-3 TaxID=208375 RepID=UPI0035D4E205